MGHYNGRLIEILLEPHQNAAGRIACPPGAAPKPGRYLQAHNPDDPLEVIPSSFFIAGEISHAPDDEVSFPVAGQLPPTWQPGTNLKLRGPLGNGFALPPRAKRIALAALAESPARLLGLMPQAKHQDAEIALFCDAPLGELPLSVELHGLEALPRALMWADYLALDLALDNWDDLFSYLGQSLPRSLPAQALVIAPMPCGGLANCGVCALTTSKGTKLVCEDGPVFELRGLL